MKTFKITLLLQVVIAIVLAIISGLFMPLPIAKIFVTFNAIFANFLTFAIPLIIIGLITPAISDIGKGAGRLLLITTVIAYGSTLFSGFFTYFSSMLTYPHIIETGIAEQFTGNDAAETLKPYFTIDMPAPVEVMTALLIAFCCGIGLSLIHGDTLKKCFSDFGEIITIIINKVIIPLLPLHIFGIFLNMTISGQAISIISLFLKVVIVIIVLHVLLLLIQFTVAGIIARKNPLKLLATMLPAYATALGSQSSAATIPVTLAQTRKNGVSENVASFVIPLCATIHLAGSTMKIVACTLAVMFMLDMPINFTDYSGFILMLGITMVAAPGVPGGAVMAALGIIEGMLGFDETMQAIIIAIYIALDGFGTACNITGDGAIAVVMDKIAGNKKVHSPRTADES